jgi:aspartyl-tRNA(Asn)/glutamyl-tRNA(Gln) amidotransferase subunit A
MNEKIFFHWESSPQTKEKDGPLSGVKIAIQPNLSVRGWPTEAGSPALEHYIALEDATVISRIRKAGAMLVGSTHMSELGFGLVGDTAGSALAEGLCDAALVTDTLGEARVASIPAGAIGYKPSYGISSRLGLIGLIPSMETIGVIARSPEIIVRIMQTISGPDPEDFSMLSEGFPDFTRIKNGAYPVKTIGIIRESQDALPSSELEAFQGALALLSDRGFEIQDLSLPDFRLFRIVHQVVGSAEASSDAGKYDSVRYGHRADGTENWNEMYLKSRTESFGLLVKSYLFQGAYFQFKNYPAFGDACRIRRSLAQETRSLFDTVDVILLPTRHLGAVPAKANTVAHVYDAFSLTCPANVTGMPAVSLSGFVKCGEVDLGLQILGPHLSDPRILSFASILLSSRKGDE